MRRPFTGEVSQIGRSDRAVHRAGVVGQASPAGKVVEAGGRGCPSERSSYGTHIGGAGEGKSPGSAPTGSRPNSGVKDGLAQRQRHTTGPLAHDANGAPAAARGSG